MATATDVKLVEKEVGHVNTDVLDGWETGMRGKQRVAGKLYSRDAPEHLTGNRLADWLIGRNAAERYRAASPAKYTHFVGRKSSGEEVVIRRKGWVARGPVITRMEQMGCMGDVMVYLFLGGDLKRTVRCGI